jgi:PAS domain S-box-containing protein
MLDDFEDLFENAPCGYLSLDPGGRIVRANATLLRWTGFEAQDFKQKRFHDLLNIAGRIYYETHFAPLLRMQGFFHEVALEFVCKSGERLPVLVNAQERRDADGNAAFIRITVFNARDRRRYEKELLAAKAEAENANQQLRELNATLESRVNEAVAERMRAEEAQRQMQKMEAVGQLTGGIAHDFNNMLAVVLGALNLIEKRLRKGEDVRGLITSATDGANRAADLTRRLLAFSRQLPLAAKPVSANRMVADMSELLKRTLGEQIEVETVLAGGLWITNTDASQLENAILNLAINARDAMPEGGKITIETANAYLDEEYSRAHADLEPGQYVMISVSDTGAGMTPEVMKRAFEPFFTTKEVGKGTGLGLSQIFGYVRQSRGHVKIYSEVGIGTSVKLYLPRYTGDAADDVANVKDDEAPRGDRMREIAFAMLSELGYTVMSAASAEAALAILKKKRPIALLFTDIVMPDMTGPKLADAAVLLRPELKVLFTTGYARNAVVHSGVVDPGARLLSKPYTLHQLARKVRDVLDA